MWLQKGCKTPREGAGGEQRRGWVYRLPWAVQLAGSGVKQVRLGQTRNRMKPDWRQQLWRSAVRTAPPDQPDMVVTGGPWWWLSSKRGQAAR